MSWRIPVFVLALAFLSWVGFEIGRAGSEIAPPRIATQSTLANGKVSGRRIDGRVWSLDYDTATMSPDGTYATIAHVRDGRLHRAGKPDVLMRATDVTVNTLTNDLTVRGPVWISEPMAAGRTRTFETVGARYTGASRTLQLDNSSTVTDGGARAKVARATVDFRTGDTKFGRIEATKAGSTH